MIWAIIRTEFEAYHSWPDAPEQVAFLRNEHRHIFKIELWIEQHHTERDVEYIQEKRKLNEWLKKNIATRSTNSCEVIANDIKNAWLSKKRRVKVFVFEDGENGALSE